MFSIEIENSKITIGSDSLFSNPVGTITHALKTKMGGIYRLLKPTYRTITIDKFFIVDFLIIIDQLAFIASRNHVGRVETLLKELKEHPGIIPLTRMNTIDVTDSIDFSRLKSLKVKPLEWQRDPMLKYHRVKQFNNARGIMLEGGIGSGKTLTSIMLMECLDVDITIFIVPNNTLNTVWMPTLEHVAYKKAPKVHNMYSGEPYQGEKFIVATYEQVRNLHKLPIKGKLGVIIDESHNYNGKKSDRSEYLINFLDAYNPDEMILLSGTPIKGSSQEMRAIMLMLTKVNAHRLKFYDKLYRSGQSSKFVRERYANITIKMNFKTEYLPLLTEYKHPIKLKNEERYYISNIRKDMKAYIKKRWEEVKPMLPDAMNTYLTLVHISSEEAIRKGATTQLEVEEYRSMIIEVVAAYEGGTLMFLGETLTQVNKYERRVLIPHLDSSLRHAFREAKTLYKYPALKLLGEALGNVVGKRRMECYVDMAKTIKLKPLMSKAAKTLFFTKYVNVVDELVNAIPGATPVYSGTGKVDSILDKFEKNRSPALCATYASLSTGVPVLMCDVLIAIDAPFMDYEWQQAKGRIHRVGQTRPCLAILVELDTGEEPNISTRNTELLNLNADDVAFLTGKKMEISAEVVNKVENTVGESNLKTYVKRRAKLFDSF